MDAPDVSSLDPRSKAAPPPRALIVDDDPGFLLGLAELVRREGFAVASAGSLKQAREEIAASPPDILLVDLHLPDGSGLDLLAAFEPTTRPRGRPDHGRRERRDRGGRASTGRHRLPDEARRLRPHQDGPGQRDAHAGDEGRDRSAAGRAAQAGPLRTADRHVASHAGRLRPDRPRGPHRRQRPDRRRDRHRQGSGRPDHPLPEPPQQGSVPARELRRHLREPDRKRAVRPRARQLHRRRSVAQGVLRARPPGDVVPRRDHGDASRAPGPAAARPGDLHAHPRGRERARSRPTCVSSPPRASGSRKRWRRASCARTCSTA